MLRVPTQRAASGMVLALPVQHPEKAGYVLLKPGATLDQTSIDRLLELNVRQVTIEYPPTAFLLRYCSPALLIAQAQLAELMSVQLDRLTQSLHAEFEFLTFAEGIRSLIQRLVDEPAAAVFMHDIVDARQPLTSHSFNVGLLSLLMGLRLDGYLVANRSRISPRRAQNIENLGVGALLHDIGMTRLSPETIKRWEASRDESDPAWQKHVPVGYAMVRGRIAPTAAAAVLHHHQRLDGSGFPKRTRGYGPPTALHGSEIHIFSRIIAVADTFDRFRAPPSSHDATPQAPTVRALRRTLELVRQHRLDPVVFKALLSVVPAFAPGSIVTLSDTRTCVVTGWEPSRPCSPTVCPLSAKAAEALSGHAKPHRPPEEVPLGEPIDLDERRDLWIVSADGLDVREDLFQPAYPGEFDMRLQYPSPLHDRWEAVDAQQMAALAADPAVRHW